MKRKVAGRNSVRYDIECVMCGEVFKCTRYDRKTCGTRCRQRLSRSERVESLESKITVLESKINNELEETLEQTWMYKVFNRAGNLLYVGITCCPKSRMKDHKSNSIWWEDKYQMTWESFESRQEAEKAEDFSIKNDNPVFNIRGR